MFKTEMHLHTKESSGCGWLTAEEMVELYSKAGYSTICICDHLKEDHLLHWGNVSWNEKMKNHLVGYKKAKRAVKKYNMNVLLTTEIEFIKTKPNHYLLIGVTEEFLINNPDICNMSIEEFYPVAKENNIFIIQAHPFRDNINFPTPDYVDGFEVYNSNPRHQDFSEKSFNIAHKYNLYMTSGSDAHRKEDIALSGIETEKEIKNCKDLIEAIKNRKINLIGEYNERTFK